MGRSVPAVSRALDILELFIENEELSMPEIVGHLGLPRTSVHELVSTLTERGYLSGVGGDTRRFQLGLRAYQVGHHYQERVELAREGRIVCEAVAAQCDETVHLAVRDHDSVVYVAKVDSTHSVRLVSALGRRLPANCTAVGKTLLASLDDGAVEALYSDNRSLPTLTANSIDSLDALLSALAVIRRDGFGWEWAESNNNVACVAAPVRDATGSVVAAMSISIPTIRLDDERKPLLEKTIQSAAFDLSGRLGYLGTV